MKSDRIQSILNGYAHSDFDNLEEYLESVGNNIQRRYTEEFYI